MPYNAPTRRSLADLLKRLQGTGYASAEGTARAAELEAIAEIASKASESLAVAGGNASSSGIADIASAYEYAHQLPSDDSLTTAERQARAVAFTRSLPHCTLERETSALLLLTAAGAPHTASRSNPNNRPEREPREYWVGVGAVAQSCDAARLILERAQPAICAPAGAGQSRMSYATTFANSGDSAVIHAASDMAFASDPTFPDTSAIQVTQGETISMSLLNEIRRSLFFAPASGPSAANFRVKNTADDTVTYRFGQWIIALGSIAAGATATLDNGDWSNVFMDVYGIWTATNITVGGGVDVTSIATSDRVWRHAVKNGATVAMQTYTGAASTCLFGRGPTVSITNNSGALRYFFLIARGTGKWWLSDDSHTAYEAVAHKSSLPRNDVIWMSRSTSIIDGNATSGWTRTLTSGGVQRGAIRRVIYTGPTAFTGYTSASVPRTVTVDTSIDWRGRWVIAYGVVQGSGTAMVSANWDVMRVASGATSTGLPVVFYTGASGGSPTTFCGVFGDGVELPYRMYADAATGALTVQHYDAGAGGMIFACGLWFVAAAPKSSDTPSQAPLDAAYVAPIDLAEPQYQGIYQQGWPSRPRLSFTDVAQSVPSNAPLGLASDGGSPPVPIQWTQRERVGSAVDSTCVVRQRIFGQRKRMISMAVPANTTLAIEPNNGFNGEPVDEIDYRDRLVWISGNVSTTDTTIATGSATADSGAPGFCVCFYTGPYGTQSATIAPGVTISHAFAKSTAGRGVHSVISVVNANGSGNTRYVTAVLECTGQLGLSDTRVTGL